MAFKTGTIQRGIATDVREMPLQSAMKTLKNYPVRTILSDGFLAIDEPFNAAVIAGMGAHLMTEIMEHAPHHEAIYVLQANDRIAYLRQRIIELGFQIVDEYVVHDRFYYVIVVVKRGHMTLSEEDVLIGPFLKEKADSRPYYEYRLRQLKKIIDVADENKKGELSLEWNYLKKRLECGQTKE
jgi:tRNA (adenine22-N1)-methyltransferase